MKIAARVIAIVLAASPVFAFASGSAKPAAAKSQTQNVDATDADGFTELMKLSEGGDLKGVEQLLKRGANVNKTTVVGESAVWFATYSGHEAIALRLIKEGAKTNGVQKETGDCLIHAAARAQLVNLTKRLKSASPSCAAKKNESGETPLSIAEALDDKNLIAILKSK